MSQQGNQSLEHGRVTRQFEDVDRELARLAYLCDVDLSNEDNVRGVIADNLPSAAARNPPASGRLSPAKFNADQTVPVSFEHVSWNRHRCVVC